MVRQPFYDRKKIMVVIAKHRTSNEQSNVFHFLKFNAWPETLKSAFEAARTVKTGKPSYRLALMKE